MRSLILIITFLLSSSVFAGPLNGETTPLFHYKQYGVKSRYELRCVEIEQNLCQKFQIYRTIKGRADITFASEFPKEKLESVLMGSLGLTKANFKGEWFYVASGLAILTGINRPLNAILLLPIGLTIDIVKAPLILPFVSAGYFYDGVKRRMLKRRFKKILENKKVKSTKIRKDFARKLRSNLKEYTF